MPNWYRSARYHYRFVTNRPVAPAAGLVVDLSLNIVGDFVSHGGFRNYNPDITRPTPHLIESGHGTMAFAGRTWDVGPGDVFVFFPGLPVDYADDVNRPWRYRWIGLEGPLALPALASIGLTPSQPHGHIGDPALVDRLLTEALSGTIERTFPPTRHIALAWQLVAAIAAKTARSGSGHRGQPAGDRRSGLPAHDHRHQPPPRRRAEHGLPPDHRHPGHRPQGLPAGTPVRSRPAPALRPDPVGPRGGRPVRLQRCQLFRQSLPPPLWPLPEPMALREA